MQVQSAKQQSEKTAKAKPFGEVSSGLQRKSGLTSKRSPPCSKLTVIAEMPETLTLAGFCCTDVSSKVNLIRRKRALPDTAVMVS